MHLLVFGPGYTASRFIAAVAAAHPAARITRVRRTATDGALALESPQTRAAIASATHILSSVPPVSDAGEDPVLAAHATALARAPALWVGYLSSTGVYGDTQGAWVDETAPRADPRAGRRQGRSAADEAWAGLHPQARVFRLPGIYGPGRSALERVRAGTAERIDQPGHVFSRIHVDDIVAALLASLTQPATGLFNIADDEPASGADVLAHAARLLGQPLPPLVPLDQARLGPMGRAFHSECRRVANGRMKRALGVNLRYPTYREGLAACLTAIRGESS
jgi:nucleoside-diphosphate-sugar epimerase